MTDDDETLDFMAGMIVAPLILVAVFIVFLPGAMWNAYVIAKVWHWYVVPLGVPALSVPWAMGLVILVSLFKSGVTNDKKINGKMVMTGFVCSFALPAIALGMAWIIHLWM